MEYKYTVIEIQTSSNGSVGIPAPATYDNTNAAFSAYYSILAIAAVSALPCHACAILRNDGLQIAAQKFVHEIGGQEPQSQEDE